MMRRILCLFGGTAMALALVSAAPDMAGAGVTGTTTSTTTAVKTTTCKRTLAPGTYATVVVPRDAVCLSDGPVVITNGLFVRQGATFVLGDEEHPGQTGIISGGVHAKNAASVQIHFSTISGGIDIQGGSGPFGGPFDVTWNTIEDSTISGPVTINGYNGFWMGFIRNHVSGTVTMTDNVLVDEDGNEYVSNVIGGNLACSGNSPAPQVGDSEGSQNIVTGAKLGQCASV